MTRDERLELLREMIDALGAMGLLRSQRSVIRDLVAEYRMTTPEREGRPEAWERALSEYELYRAQSGSTREVA